MTLVDLTHDELRALAQEQRRVQDPGRETDLHSAFGKACEALHNPTAFEWKPPAWAQVLDQIPDQIDVKDLVVIVRAEDDRMEYGGQPAQGAYLFCSEHLQPWQVLGLLHIAHEQTRRMM